MRRRGKVFKVIKWAMTLLSLALLALFVASGFSILAVEGELSKWVYCFNACEGRLRADCSRLDEADYGPIRWHNLVAPEFDVIPLRTGWPVYSFRKSFTFWTGAYHRVDWDIPLQAIVLAALVPAVMLWWFERKKHSPGHCPHCGYDLTGSESGVCPECGMAVQGCTPAPPG